MDYNVLKMLSESETFGGIVFSGNYTMGIDALKVMLECYNESGVNPLDSYTRCIHLEWDLNDKRELPGDTLLTEEEAEQAMKDIDLIDELGLLRDSQSERLRNAVNQYHNNWIAYSKRKGESNEG